MIQAFRILCRCRGTKVQTRLMALGSIFCMLYFLVVTFTVTALAWFEILPNLYPHKPDSITSHKIVISFVFMNAMGNCVLILGTDTSIHRLSKELKKKSTEDQGIQKLRRVSRSCSRQNPSLLSVRGLCSEAGPPLLFHDRLYRVL